MLCHSTHLGSKTCTSNGRTVQANMVYASRIKISTRATTWVRAALGAPEMKPKKTKPRKDALYLLQWQGSTKPTATSENKTEELMDLQDDLKMLEKVAKDAVWFTTREGATEGQQHVIMVTNDHKQAKKYCLTELTEQGAVLQLPGVTDPVMIPVAELRQGLQQNMEEEDSSSSSSSDEECDEVASCTATAASPLPHPDPRTDKKLRKAVSKAAKKGGEAAVKLGLKLGLEGAATEEVDPEVMKKAAELLGLGGDGGAEKGEGASEPSDLTAVLKAVMGGALGTDLGGQVRGDKKKADKMKEGLKAERRAAKDELKAHKRSEKEEHKLAKMKQKKEKLEAKMQAQTAAMATMAVGDESTSSSSSSSDESSSGSCDEV